MSTFIDRTNQVFNELKVIEDTGGREVKTQCLKCNNIDTYNKSNLVSNRIHCRVCSSRRINSINQVYKDFIVKQELGRYVVAQCLKCGHTDKYLKDGIINKKVNCKKCYTRVIDRTGKEFNGIKIVKELGHGQIIGECMHCHEQKRYKKSRVVEGRIHSCGCIPGPTFISRIGKIYKGLKIIKDNGNGLVTVQCTKCKGIQENNKSEVIKGEVICKKCKNDAISKVGFVHDTLEIIRELGNGVVECECNKCGHIDKYDKYNILTHKATSCKVCGVKENVATTYRKLEGHTINNILVTNFEYVGRDKKCYYTCKCVRCSEELLLSYEEIFEYKCNKE